MPDFENVLVSGPTYPYTATQKCWLVGIFLGNTSCTVLVNNIAVSRASGYTGSSPYSYGSIQMPLDVGDVVTVSSNPYTNGLNILGIKS